MLRRPARHGWRLPLIALGLLLPIAAAQADSDPHCRGDSLYTKVCGQIGTSDGSHAWSAYNNGGVDGGGFSVLNTNETCQDETVFTLTKVSSTQFRLQVPAGASQYAGAYLLATDGGNVGNANGHQQPFTTDAVLVTPPGSAPLSSEFRIKAMGQPSKKVPGQLQTVAVVLSTADGHVLTLATLLNSQLGTVPISLSSSPPPPVPPAEATFTWQADATNQDDDGGIVTGGGRTHPNCLNQLVGDTCSGPVRKAHQKMHRKPHVDH